MFKKPSEAKVPATHPLPAGQAAMATGAERQLAPGTAVPAGRGRGSGMENIK